MSTVKYRIAATCGKSLATFTSEASDAEAVIECRSKAMALLAKSRTINVTYEKYNTMIQDWVSFGGMEASL